ncbi:hypothetical protein ACN20G_28285 (plasmid) [Streptomyces sp. BI20]|uniref:hypothetical protein n=1 Tax=Streptomyces sp. BI20 TaxID=3403460 RepID=UPI003C78DFED
MIRISGAVRRQLGERVVDAIVANPPGLVECRVCRRACRPPDDVVSLSVQATPGRPTLVAWSHRECAGSRVLSQVQFLAAVQHSATLMTEAEQAEAEAGTRYLVENTITGAVTAEPRRPVQRFTYVGGPMDGKAMEWREAVPPPDAIRFEEPHPATAYAVGSYLLDEDTGRYLWRPALRWRPATPEEAEEASALPDFVPAKGGTVVCDLCEKDRAVCYYDVTPFVVEITAFGGFPMVLGSGRWFNACPTCADLIDADDQAAVMARANLAERIGHAIMVDGFFASRTGTGRTALTGHDGDHLV